MRSAHSVAGILPAASVEELFKRTTEARPRLRQIPPNRSGRDPIPLPYEQAHAHCVHADCASSLLRVDTVSDRGISADLQCGKCNQAYELRQWNNGRPPVLIGGLLKNGDDCISYCCLGTVFQLPAPTVNMLFVLRQLNCKVCGQTFVEL
ncbi:TPA: hypothetical protein DCZ32_02130 [Candidatus Uhrbacteria bacterium]|nr:hypothetical protein [Candidatus Uhrbacteria bacterium]